MITGLSQKVDFDILSVQLTLFCIRRGFGLRASCLPVIHWVFSAFIWGFSSVVKSLASHFSHFLPHLYTVGQCTSASHDVLF